MLSAPFQIPALGRAAFRPFAKNPIPDQLIASWLEPSLSDPQVRADLRKVTVGFDKHHTLAAADKLRIFKRPVLFAWATADRFFPIE